MSAQAIPLTGSSTEFWQEQTISLSSIDVDLGTGLTATGPITLTLAPNKLSAFGFNFDTMTASEEVYMLANFPLLASLGAEPLVVYVLGSGPITSSVPDLPVGPNQVLSFTAAITGSGTIASSIPSSSGGFFNWIISPFSNGPNVNQGNVTVGPGGSYTKNITCGTVDKDTTVTIQGSGIPGNLQTSSGTGSGTICPFPVPAPLPLIGLGAAFGYSRKLRKHIKTNNSPEVMSAFG
jgi:hypothetical protein